MKSRIFKIVVFVIIIAVVNPIMALAENDNTKINNNQIRLSGYSISEMLINQELAGFATENNVGIKYEVLTAELIKNDPNYVKGKPYKLTKDTSLSEDFSFDCELTIDLNNKSLYVPSNYNNVYITGALCSITAMSFKLCSSDTGFMSTNNSISAKTGLYFSELNQALIDEAPSNSVITLLGIYGTSFSQPALFVNTKEGKGGVYLDKGVYSGSRINYAVAYIINPEPAPDQYIYYESLQSAIDDVRDEVDKEVIHLSSNTKEDIVISANNRVILDLNNHVLNGSIESFGYITIRNEEAIKSGSEGIGTGEVKGKLIYSDPSHFRIEHGIFDLGYEFDDDGLLKNVDDRLISENSSGYEISRQWVVLENNLSGKLNLNYSLEYKIFESDATNIELLSGSGMNLVKSLDGDDVPDLAAGEEYMAVIYLKGTKNGAKIRSFDFKATYDPSIMIDDSNTNSIKNDIMIKANTMINRYNNSVYSNGVISFSMATSSIDIGAEGIDGKIAIATFNFKINPAAESVKAGADVIFDFVRDYSGKTSYLGTMESIHKIPFKEYVSFSGKIKNINDGVKFYDYAYAPKGYKLAVIADEHPEGKTVELADGSIPVYYTRNEAYVTLSSNPLGKFIKPQDNEKAAKSDNPDDKFGVYLAFVPNSVAEEDGLNTYKNIFSYIDGDENDSIIDDKYSNIDLDGEDGTQVNDASIAYQMLRFYSTGGVEGDQWGYESQDGSSRIISAYQRLLAENNHDGKLYGTIEDVFSILNNEK